MRYKAMAMRLRQATGTKDPTPTSALLGKKARHEVVKALLADGEPVFSRLFAALDWMISPKTVFLDAPRRSPGKKPPWKAGNPIKGLSAGDPRSKRRRPRHLRHALLAVFDNEERGQADYI